MATAAAVTRLPVEMEEMEVRRMVETMEDQVVARRAAETADQVTAAKAAESAATISRSGPRKMHPSGFTSWYSDDDAANKMSTAVAMRAIKNNDITFNGDGDVHEFVRDIRQLAAAHDMPPRFIMQMVNGKVVLLFSKHYLVLQLYNRSKRACQHRFTRLSKTKQASSTRRNQYPLVFLAKRPMEIKAKHTAYAVAT